MHLLFLIYSLGGGGAERVTVNLANHWIAQGHRVTIATLAGGDEPSYRLASGVERIHLDIARETQTSLEAVTGVLRSVIAVRRMLKRERPHAAIGMMTTSAVLLAFAARGLNLRTAGAERTHPPNYPPAAVWERLRRLSYRWLSVVVAQTEETSEWLRQNTAAKHVSVIPNPWLPLERNAPVIAPAATLPTGASLILAVGRLSEEKQFDLLIGSFAEVASKHPDWHMSILGEGPEREKLEGLVERHGLNGRVSLPGRVGNPGDWYERADMFVLSSAFEGFPNVLLEAMGSRLPVIAFACPTGPADLVTNGVNGLLVPPLDGGELARTMDRLMSDSLERERLGKTAKQVRNTYRMCRIGDLWLSVLAPEPAQ
jgi:glycosyltransferase involved in cell wall biosynthesis